MKAGLCESFMSRKAPIQCMDDALNSRRDDSTAASSSDDEVQSSVRIHDYDWSN